MKQTICILLSAIAISLGCSAKKQTSIFPDGTPISSWFADTTGVELKDMGKPYIITDYGVVNDSTIIQTQKIQKVIDRCHANGGGVIVVPAGTYLTGSLFFKPGCNLYLEENATLKGSDAITHYQIVKTRLEGQTLDYLQHSSMPIITMVSPLQAREPSTATDINSTMSSGCAEKSSRSVPTWRLSAQDWSTSPTPTM